MLTQTVQLSTVVRETEPRVLQVRVSKYSTVEFITSPYNSFTMKFDVRYIIWIVHAISLF